MTQFPHRPEQPNIGPAPAVPTVAQLADIFAQLADLKRVFRPPPDDAKLRAALDQLKRAFEPPHTPIKKPT